jgi:hypothetical protein
MKDLPFDIVFKGLFLILFAFLFVDNKRIREQNERLGKDISGLSVALQTNMDTTRNALGQMKATTNTVILSEDQATKILRGDIKAMKDNFSFKISGLRSFSQVGSRYTIPIYTPGKDTVIYNNTEKVYYTPQGMLYTKGDTLVGSVIIKDTIRIVVSKGKREQWWKIWQKRPLVTNAFLSHPDGTITQLKSILAE